MRLASALCSSYRSLKIIWNKSPPDNFDIIGDKSLIMTWGSSLIFFKSCQCKPVALFWISTPSLLCSAARRDQQEIRDPDTTTDLGDGAMEITANDDQKICVKAQPWNSLHHLFSFVLCKNKALSTSKGSQGAQKNNTFCSASGWMCRIRNSGLTSVSTKGKRKRGALQLVFLSPCGRTSGVIGTQKEPLIMFPIWLWRGQAQLLCRQSMRGKRSKVCLLVVGRRLLGIYSDN